ncbi:unnamed protein product [Chondrus crispus]|uniref:Uncharacterized protein n=1 Tax=Chondrus crispus TaxID=2769 RepID=R7QD83_CHOCR|nr:unnamed protein product [Chondrus crispus]CDF36009.1 unnamed protein product [Chondrus crispus]|eukprot:XP_005715828.1 unnamed protein product [Chondrus crispus]
MSCSYFTSVVGTHPSIFRSNLQWPLAELRWALNGQL